MKSIRAYFYVDEGIKKLKNRSVKIVQFEEQDTKRMKKNEQNICNLCDNIKHTNVCIIGISGREKRSLSVNWHTRGLVDAR